MPKSISLRSKKSPAAPTAASLHRLLQPKFPLPIAHSWRQWLRRHDLSSAEAAVLDCVGLNPAKSHKQFNVRSIDVRIQIDSRFVRNGSNNVIMNELEISNSKSVPSSHVVLVHGYGASKGFFYKNFRDIVLGTNSKLHALDWLGYGRSSRVPVNLPNFATRKEGVLYAEDFFLEAFEKWREARNIKKLTLVAHSLGAYVACAYASRYSSRVEKIVLVSPASVNRTKLSISKSELMDSNEISPEVGEVPNPPKWFNWMWEQHWSPFSLVRNSGCLGPKITSGWTSRRFSDLPEVEREALQRYAYTMFNAPGSGEYMLNYFLACGGAGRWPLVERLRDLKCPTLWLYGDNDWMPPAGGEEAIKRLQSKGLMAELAVIDNSGHHLYLDKPQQFNELVVKFLRANTN